jgi:hypothetical protein
MKKTMTPLSIEEILELPIGSKVIVKSEQKLGDLIHCKTVCAEVSSVSDAEIYLSEEVSNVHSFYTIDLSKTSSGTVIQDSLKILDATDQVFLDTSGVDRVYSDWDTFQHNKYGEKFSMVKSTLFEYFPDWHPGQRIQATDESGVPKFYEPDKFLAVLNARLKP